MVALPGNCFLWHHGDPTAKEPENQAIHAYQPVLHRARNYGCARHKFSAAQADIYQLANGGELRGELVNRDDSARRTFVIRTFDGATVTLERSQVKQIVSQTPADLEYEKIRPDLCRHCRRSITAGRMVQRKIPHPRSTGCAWNECWSSIRKISKPAWDWVTRKSTAAGSSPTS